MAAYDGFGSIDDFDEAFERAFDKLRSLGCAVNEAKKGPAHQFHRSIRKWRTEIEPFFRDTVDSDPLCHHMNQFANYAGYPPDWCWRRAAVQLRALWVCDEEEHDFNVSEFANRTGVRTTSVQQLLMEPTLFDTDHIIPMSEFREHEFIPGDEPHSLANLRCVCIICHAVKHANIEEQPRFQKFVAAVKRLG